MNRNVELAMSNPRDRARRSYAAIHRILMEAWDPIGVADVPEAQDEYDSYVAGVYSRLIHRAPWHELLDYLWQVETEHMGLKGDRQRTEHVVNLLLNVPEQINDAS